MTFEPRSEVVSARGVVASTHSVASEVGIAVLERGGNAFDAAVAMGFALQVAEPHLNGPGGEFTAIFHSARDGVPQVLCAQGVAPARASVAAALDLGLDRIPGTGLLAACVPGAFDGWMLLLRNYGTMPLREVLGPAIALAHRGVPVARDLAETFVDVAPLFESGWETSAQQWLRGGLPKIGAMLRNPELAVTYERLVREAEQCTADREGQIDNARKSFYEGFIAHAIDSFVSATCAVDDSGRRHQGWLSGHDLSNWCATLERPVQLDYRGVTVCKTGPWGQGPVFLAQLAMLAQTELPSAMETADYIHLRTEIAKLAFADREAWYGDPGFTDVPVAELLSADYARERLSLIGDEASSDLRPGVVGGRDPRLPRGLDHAVEQLAPPTRTDAETAGGEPTFGSARPGDPTFGTARTGDTCHLDAADRFGNVIAATPSGGWLQSSPAIPGLGFCLGTRAQMFWVDEEHPNGLAPGRRPRTTLSPTLTLRNGQPDLAFGTPGGDQQDQWTLSFFLAHVAYGLRMQAAIDLPEFDTRHFPSSFYPRSSVVRDLELEDRVGEKTVRQLLDRGHRVSLRDGWSLGRVCGVARLADGTLHGAADPRGARARAIGL